MRLKGIAAFSIILMALIVAPQAASDLREFLGNIAESAQIAFLHAVIESRTAVMSGNQRKVMSSDCLQRLIKTALMEKNRSTHQLLRPTVPVFKASRILPETFAPPPAVEPPPVADANEADTNESKVNSISVT